MSVCAECGRDDETVESGPGWCRTHGPRGCVTTRVLGPGRISIDGALFAEDSRGMMRPAYCKIPGLD